MGEPYFKVKQLVEQHGVRVFSSNYALYGDMSRRVMYYLGSVVPDIEIYSIDEAFLDLRGTERYHRHDLAKYARDIQKEVYRRTHIPTCIGIGPTKTLAKLANRLTKKNPALGGICYLDTDAKRQWALEQVAVEDVWGIGRQYAVKMHEAGIHTAAALAQCTEAWVRKHLGGVVGARLVRELQGIPCYAFQPREDDAAVRQSIACTRSFGTPLSSFADLLGAIGAFASRAAEKLRRQGSAVNTMTVFISKNKYGSEPPPYTFSTVVALPVATADTSDLLRHARIALKRIWQPNTLYIKAGVVLAGLETAGQQQLSLFSASNHGEARARLLQDLDQLNQRFGAGTVHFATAVVPKGNQQAPWLGNADFKSSAYTTSWDQLWALRA